MARTATLVHRGAFLVSAACAAVAVSWLLPDNFLHLKIGSSSERPVASIESASPWSTGAVRETEPTLGRDHSVVLASKARQEQSLSELESRIERLQMRIAHARPSQAGRMRGELARLYREYYARAKALIGESTVASSPNIETLQQSVDDVWGVMRNLSTGQRQTQTEMTEIKNRLSKIEKQNAKNEGFWSENGSWLIALISALAAMATALFGGLDHRLKRQRTRERTDQTHLYED